MAALQANGWRIEHVELDGAPRLKLTRRRGYLVGYFTATDSLVRALEQAGGPGLAEFEPETENDDGGVAAAG